MEYTACRGSLLRAARAPQETADPAPPVRRFRPPGGRPKGVGGDYRNNRTMASPRASMGWTRKPSTPVISSTIRIIMP